MKEEQQQEVGPTFLPSMSTMADIYFIGTLLLHYTEKQKNTDILLNG